MTTTPNRPMASSSISGKVFSGISVAANVHIAGIVKSHSP